MLCEEMVKNVSSMKPIAPKLATCLAICLALFLGPVAPAAVEARIDNGHYLTNPTTGYAVDGYDPVAYFVDETARRGTDDHEIVWERVAWRFVNEGNRAAFTAAPLIYAPRFGGRCPVTLARGFAAEGDPRLWAIAGGRLYFFHTPENRDAFLKDPDGMVAQARAHWDRLFPY